MILNSRKGLTEESGWERIETRIRTWIYVLIHELLQSQMIMPSLYKLLLIIECFQFFWYSVHRDFSFLWDNGFANLIRTIVEYFQFDSLLTRGNSGFFVGALYAVFSIQIIIILMAIFTTVKLVHSNKKTSTILSYCLKILSIYGILINTVLALPFFHIFISALYCNSSDTIHGDLDCYQGAYFAHLVIGIFGIIFMLLISIIFNILYIDLNPCSTIPFAAPQSRLNLLRLVIKIIIPIYATIDYARSSSKVFIALYGVVWILILILRYRQTPFYNHSVFSFVISADTFMFWAALVSNVLAFIDTENRDETSLFYLFCLGILISYGYVYIVFSRQNYFLRSHLKNFNKHGDVEYYILTIFHLIENRDKPQERMKLEGLVKYYIKNTNRKDLEEVSYSLLRDYIKDEEPEEKLWYTWVKFILIDALERFPKSARLHLLYAYIQREKLNNKFKALFEMMITEENKPNMEEEFSIYRYKNLIEEEMIEVDARNAESKGVDVNVIVHFQNKFVEFQGIIENAVELHLDFWRELLESNPDIQKLQGLGSRITHSVEETSDNFRRLNDINPNHIKMLQIYGNFLKDIVNDDAEGQRILEKAEYVDKSAMVNKQFIDVDRLKYGENSNTCIITCSGNFNMMGQVTNVNNEINRILGFAKGDLIGQTISRIMPKAIADIHENLMRRYFETSEAKVIGMERIIFPIDKSGYIVPCSLMIKVLPNLDEGIRLVGFLKDIEKETGMMKNAEFDTEEQVHYLIYSGDTGTIHGITKSCRQTFGIPASLVYGSQSATNEFSIDAIMPEILQHSSEDLKAQTGVITTLDTSSLQQNYLAARAESEKSEYEDEAEEDKERRFRKTKIRVVLVDEQNYAEGLNLKVLKFVEVLDGDENRNASMVDDDKKRDDGNKSADEGAENAKQGNEEASQEDNNHSEGNSSISAGDSVNDDIRTLKDFKALISEKTTPKSIKILSRTVILIFALLIVLSSIELSFKFNQYDDFQSGVSTVATAYQRHNLMAEINYRIRKLQLLATNYLVYSGTLEENRLVLQGQLVTLIDGLSSVQFQIMQATQTLASENYPTIDSQNIILEHQLETTTENETRIFTDSVFQYITAASSIRNSSLTNLATPSIIDSTLKNFFFVRRNGYGPLRNGSEYAAQNFYNYYISVSDDYNTDCVAIMAAAISLLFVSILILIPIVFSVHKTNNRVLSLFGYIPLNEISELAAKCERYMQTHLEDHKERKDLSYEASEEDIEPSNRSHNGENSYLEVSQNPDAGGDVTLNQESVQLDVSENMGNNPVGVVPVASSANNATSKSNTLKIPKKPGLSGQIPEKDNNVSVSAMSVQQDNARLKKNDPKVDTKKVTANLNEDKKNMDAEAEAEFAQDRSQKLLNSRDNRRSKVIIQFTSIMLIFVAYFVGDYVDEKNYLDDVRSTLRHLQLISMRTPNIRYIVGFTLEEMAMNNTNDVYYYEGYGNGNYRDFYESTSQTNEKSLSDSIGGTFPSDFNGYLSLYDQYNNRDLCNAYYSSDLNSCQNVSSGLLTKGLVVSITTVNLNCDDVMKIYNTLPKSFDNQKTYINTQKYKDSENILDKIAQPIQSLISTYQSSYNTFLNSRLTIDKVKFTIFILLVFFVFVFLWMRYLQGLNDKIFRTKGMLNMIPMDIISKNENLKQLFFGGDILQAVK